MKEEKEMNQIGKWLSEGTTSSPSLVGEDCTLPLFCCSTLSYKSQSERRKKYAERKEWERYANANSHTLSLATNNTHSKHTTYGERELSVVEIGGNGIEKQLLLMLYGEEEQVPLSHTRACITHSWTFVLEQEGQSGRGALRVFHSFFLLAITLSKWVYYSSR